MTFKRSFGISRPLPQGYHAPSTEDVNTEQASFEIGKRVKVFESFEDFSPDRLVIQGRLKPILHTPTQTIHAYFTMANQRFHPYPLYQKDKLMERYGCLKAIEIHLERILFPVMTKDFKIDHPQIYQKKFSVQTEESCVLTHEMRDGKWVMSPPGIVGKQPLWCYGGFYQPGCQLHEIEQIVFTPTREQDKTILHLSRISSWHTKGHEVAFIDPLEENQKLSLVGEIEKGHITFKWFQGMDEKGVPYQNHYQSFLIHQKDRLSDVVEIHFRKKGENDVGI